MTIGRCLTHGHVIGTTLARGVKHAAAVVTVGHDGVFIYDVFNGNLIRSWALNLPNWIFSAPAVLVKHSSVEWLFVPIHEQENSGNSKLIVWNGLKTNAGGSLSLHLADHIALPSPAYAVLPKSKHSQKSTQHSKPISSSAGGQITSDAAENVVVGDDVEAKKSLMAFVVLQDGCVCLCSSENLLDLNDSVRGMPVIGCTLWASDEIVAVHVVRGSSSILVSRFSARGNKLVCESLQQVEREENGAYAISATFTSGRACVVWSDGQVISYECLHRSIVNPRGSLIPSITRNVSGFAHDLKHIGKDLTPSSPKSNGKTPKKRTLKAAQKDSGSQQDLGYMQISAIGEDGILAIVGWSNSDELNLRIVCMDAIYGAVLYIHEYRPKDIGIAKFEDPRTVQVSNLQSNQISYDGVTTLPITAGGAALTLEIPTERPSLASLVGALSFGAQQKEQATAKATISPYAKYAHTLHSDSHQDVSHLININISKEFEPTLTENKSRGKKFTSSDKTIGKRFCDVTGDLIEPVTLAIKNDSRRHGGIDKDIWNKLEHAAHLKKGITSSSFATAMKPLLEFLEMEEQKDKLSYNTLCRVLVTAAEVKNWGIIGKLIDVQHPISLLGCPGLVPALAEAGEIHSLHRLLLNAKDLCMEDIAKTIEILLSPRKEKKGPRLKAEEALSAELHENAEAALSAIEKAMLGGKNSIEIDKLIHDASIKSACIQGFKPSNIVLHSLLNAHHDECALVDALRTLSSVSAVQLLCYLLQWMRNYRTLMMGVPYQIENNNNNELNKENCATKEYDRIVDLNVILDWISATFDACFSRLMLHPAAVKVCEQLYEEVEPWTKSLTSLSRVKGAVEHLRAGAPLALAATDIIGHYNLEWLSLKVSQ